MALQKRVPEAYRERLKNGVRSVRSMLQNPSPGRNSQLDALKRIRSEIESITLPVFGAERSDRDESLVASNQNDWAETRQSLDKITTEISPGSILAIGAKWRECSISLARAGNQVITFDKDSAGVTELYRDARDTNLSLLPLVMDFTDPTPSRGLANHLSIAAAERLRCDMVVALGLFNQIVSERHLRFDQIVDGLGKFSKRWLLIDFSQHAKCSRSSVPYSWYTVENLIAALKKQFRKIKFVSSDSRSDPLLFCER